MQYLKDSSKALNGSQDSADDLLEDEKWIREPRVPRPVGLPYQTPPGFMAHVQLVFRQPPSWLALVADKSY